MPQVKRRKVASPTKSADGPAKAFELRKSDKSTKDAKSQVHLLGRGIVCDTEARGHKTPQGRSPARIVVDASEGFIPLWGKNQRLRWRFQARSMNNFRNPAAAKAEIRKLFADALLEWGTAAPVKFTEDNDVWDFEIVMKRNDDCDASGCVLASAFFPDAGRHQFIMYPKLFSLSRKEQVETFIHEIGHIFGLRHFFALVSETEWPARIFGTHSKFSIMNYGALSTLTADDKSDLKRLYQLVWTGAMTDINGTPVRLVKPFSALAPSPDTMVAVAQVDAALEPQPKVAYLGADYPASLGFADTRP
jgi:hypothetical protein